MKVVLAILSPVAGLLGVVLGWWLGYLKESRNQVRRRLSYWSAMSAEVEECKGLAEAYLRREAKAPLYRLSTTAYDHAWPGLLGDGAASGEEARAILRFYGQVIQINRGLDYAASLRIDSQKALLDEEVNRLMLKAKNLIDPKCTDPGGPYYSQVRTVIDMHVKSSGSDT